MIDISIVIVNWNGKSFLLDCLKSIKNSRVSKNYEIIVVDNASTDGSMEAVRKTYPEVKAIRNEKNEGFARGNNIGIRETKGKYICLINSDIKVIEGCLDRMYSFMESHPSVGISGPQILNPDGTIQFSCREFPSLWNNFCFAFGFSNIFPNIRFFSNEQQSYFSHEARKSIEAISGCFMMVRGDALEQVGLLDERFFIYCEDIDWCKRFREKGWDIVFNPDAQAIHYAGASSANEPMRFSIEKQRAILKYWSKHHCLSARLILFLVLFLHHLLRFLANKFTLLWYPSRKGEIAGRIKVNLECLRDLLAFK
jgi:hypothetical protein